MIIWARPFRGPRRIGRPRFSSEARRKDVQQDFTSGRFAERGLSAFEAFRSSCTNSSADCGYVSVFLLRRGNRINSS